MNNQSFVHLFANGATTGRYGNMFIENDVLYSYGHHFPLAIRKKWGAGIEFLINGDVYSRSTSRHTRYCIEECKPNVQIPFSALQSAGLIPRWNSWNFIPPDFEIVSYRADTWETVCKKCRKPVQWINQEPYGYRHIDGTSLCCTQTEPPETTSIHTLGAVLLKYKNSQGKVRYFLSSTDFQERGRGYFLSELSKPVKTVDAAFDGLKPTQVKIAEQNGEEVLRQGDCFFINTNVTDKVKHGISHKHAQILGTNHYATEVKIYGKVFFCRGTVRHKPEGRPADHKMLTLGKTWHIAYKNTAKQSWSARGQVD